MGRQTSTIPKSTFFIKNKTKARESILYIRYFVCGKYVGHSTGIKLPAADWDPDTRQVRRSSPNYKRLTAQIDAFRSKTDAQILECDERLTPKIVSDILNGTYTPDPKKSRKVDFIEYAATHNRDLYDLGRLGYSTYYNADLNIKKFGKFLKDRMGIETLYLMDLNVDLFNKYILYRKDVLGNTSNEGINKALVPLYKAVKYAADNGLVERGLATSISTNYLEKKTRSYSGETDEEKVRYLTDTQFHDLLDVYDRTRNEATRKIMDMFLFSYYVCGLRYSDLLTLEWRHIDFESKTLTKNVYKTKRSISLPLVDKAVEILRRWQDIGHNRRFVFNLLDEKFNLSDTIKLNNARITKNRNIQQSLRSVGIRMGLKFNLTIHVARHTFAVQALKNGMDVHTISHLMGHSSSLVTEKVYAEFLPDTINTTIREQLERNVIKYSSS